MTVSALPALEARHLAEMHARFLAILPRIELHGRIYFRHLRCPHQKADAIQEMRSLAWLWFVRLARRGKDPGDFVTTFVSLLGRAVSSGRRRAGMAKAKDVLNPAAQKQHVFTVGKLPDCSTLSSNPVSEALHDNTKSPPPDAATFRCDFPAWLSTHTERDRKIAEDLMIGERTLDVARRFGLSPSRVSQKRREFHDDWKQFHG